MINMIIDNDIFNLASFINLFLPTNYDEGHTKGKIVINLEG